MTPVFPPFGRAAHWRGLLLIWLLAACLCAAALPVRAAAESGTDAVLQGWDNLLDQIEVELASQDIGEERYQEIRTALQGIADEAEGLAAAARGTASVTQQMLDALGPPPGEGEPAEAEVIVRERERLSKSLAGFNAQVRRAELAATRAGILLRSANLQRMERFTGLLLQRGALPLLPSTWQEVPPQALYLHDQFFTPDVERPIETLNWDERLMLIIAGIAAFAVGIPLRRWVRRRYGQQRPIAEPSYRERVTAAVAEMIVRSLMPALAVLFVLTALMAALNDRAYVPVLRPFVEAAALGLVFFFYAWGLLRALIAPGHPHWRLANITDAAARGLAWRMTLLAGLLSLTGALVLLLDRIAVPPDIFAVVFFALTLLTALALIAVVWPARLWQRPTAAAAKPAPVEELPPLSGLSPANGAPLAAAVPATESGWPKLRTLALIVALFCICASGLGYHNLARYVGQIFFAGLLLGGLVQLLRGLVREGLEAFAAAPGGRLAQWRRTFFPRERGLQFFQFVAAALFDVAFFLLWLLLMMPVAGVAWTEVDTWGRWILAGISIGGVVLKPADILLALLAFLLAVTVTRFIQRRLDDRLLAKLQIDRGVRNSINTGVGYVGVILAIVIGIGTLGLDLSNLALIAGALSVGIGFGLQNIVQNFVAGLILLVERPVKVGDWVVVGGNQGIVKRISVRATEIQTFQRSSVIVPNAEFVSSAVTNWTHKDKVARVEVMVGVDYGTDLKKLRQVLMDCAQSVPHVLRFPAPMVIFKDFGPSSLDFEVRVFIADADYMVVVASELRFLIAERFSELGIGIPFTQQVVHIPQLESLQQAIGEAKAIREELKQLQQGLRPGPAEEKAGG